MKAVLRRSLLWWLPLPVIGTVNGILRGLLLNLFLSDFVARQFSSLLMIIWVLIYIEVIYEKLNLEKTVDAWITGATWLLLTVVLEFILGYFILGSSLGTMLAEYNLLAGRFWVLVLVSILFGPILYFKFGEHDPVTTRKKAT